MDNSFWSDFYKGVGKYYLGDADYGVQKGIISPYRGVCYNLKEFFSDNPPRNDKELFNLHHSSLRTSIERCFGVLKKRFCILDRCKTFLVIPNTSGSSFSLLHNSQSHYRS